MSNPPQCGSSRKSPSSSAPTAGAALSLKISRTRMSARWLTRSRDTRLARKSRARESWWATTFDSAPNDFARVAAETLASAGTPVFLAQDACPTPAVSLLVRQRAAAGGIQITASHNPVSLERREIQGELWKLGVAGHRRANRAGACGRAARRSACACAAPRSDTSRSMCARRISPRFPISSIGTACARRDFGF